MHAKRDALHKVKLGMSQRWYHIQCYNTYHRYRSWSRYMHKRQVPAKGYLRSDACYVTSHDNHDDLISVLITLPAKGLLRSSYD